MVAKCVADLTLDELRDLIRHEFVELSKTEPETESDELLYSDLSDFPVDDLGPWPDDSSLRREDSYDDEAR